MPSGPAETLRRAGRVPGRPWWWGAGLALVLAIVVLVWGVWGGAFRSTEVPVPAPGTSDSGSGADRSAARSAEATALLGRLQRRLTHGSRAQTLALATPGDARARRRLGTIYDNAQALDIAKLGLRYVAEQAGVRPSQRGTDARRAWVADVETSFRVGGYDTGVSRMEVSFEFTRAGGSASFAGVGGHDNAAPLWLVGGELKVASSPHTLVASAGTPSRTAALERRAVRARHDVRRVLPGFDGDLVFELAESEAQLDRILGAKPDAYSSIAAVTTTVDGSTRSSAPVHVMVNPEVYGKLGRNGAQVVISHEATHVATQAALAQLPLWLLEGFADYVALDHAGIPVGVAGGQILGDVAKSGPPEHLPGEAQFDPSSSKLGVTYESAWLACRYLAQTYGEQKLIRVYRRVDDGASVATAFRDVLGTTKKEFVRGWQDSLVDLARRTG